MDNMTACIPLAWSADAADAIEPSLKVCIIAVIFHSMFWLSIFTHSKLRQWESMQWLYAFLIVDFFLLMRFFILYGLRTSSACVTITIRSFVCYFESVGDIYLNYLQGYILLSLNMCRHFQITRGEINIYSAHRHLMFIIHCFIYILPLLILIIEIQIGWTVSYRRSGGSCDLDYAFLSIRILNTFFGYCFPVILTLLFLILSLHHVRMSVATMHTQQIIDARLKYHRLLVIQSFVFYSVWILLWSPNVIVSQYVYVSSTVGATAQLLNYIELTLDPMIISALDVRFLKAWRKTFTRMKRQVAPDPNG